MGFCEAWISGLGGGEESHWVMRHWVGLKVAVLGYVWVQILVWVGLGGVRKWEVKKRASW